MLDFKRKLFALTTLVILIAATTGCGQKGPLKAPSDQEPASSIFSNA